MTGPGAAIRSRETRCRLGAEQIVANSDGYVDSVKKELNPILNALHRMAMLFGLRYHC